MVGFKNLRIGQVKLQGEADSANGDVIAEALPLLQNKCAEYPLERIYNMNETGFFISMFFLKLLINILSLFLTLV